jgi:cation:H+ antiporter
MGILFDFLYVIGILAAIVLACVVFTNAVEHLGEKLNLSEGVVGSVLAAVGTALPETIVPLVAIIGAYITGSSISTGEEIGIGAILGAPFLLGTLAFFVTGLAVIIFARAGKRSLEMPVNTSIMFRDLHYFAFGYMIAILSSFIPVMQVKYAIAGLLILIYGVYVYRTINDSCKGPVCDVEDLGILYLTKFIKVPQPYELAAIIFQIVLSLAGIILLAHLFVEELKHVSGLFGISPLILSLIITPIATELPEKFNSVIWIRAKKDTLAMGNITGAMVFQSCIPTAVGLALTPWVLSIEAFVNVIIVYMSVGVVYLNIVRNKGVLCPSALLTGGFFYLLYLVYVILKSMGLINFS